MATAKQRESTPDAIVQNYFNYFTEIEEHFQRRRGSLLLLSTLDWALIETWREAGIPLEVVLRGIDEAFDKYEARQRSSSRRLRQVNGLAWCAQAVMEAAEQQKEAALGVASGGSAAGEGLHGQRIVDNLKSAAQALQQASIAPEPLSALAASLHSLTASLLRQLPNL